ncbi:hypothetical protein B0I35DRAFT_180829 [Stachybotrys elegans]|uniref:C2H2-type domain-containing protein n=1 Tax=Stachybotrys elegans TaxID=80388 RepID=A0A8K0SBH2_9HYPO|nr:hypothetical protein B0I35DRAFT_180829 [Stachybotrys elegans]
MATLCYPSASPRLFEPPSHSSLSKQKSHIAGKLAAVSQSWRRTQAPNSASSKEQSRKTARPNSGNTSHAEPPPKRPRFSVDPSDGDDDSNNDDNNFEPRKKFRLVIKSGEPLFACPFYKRDPIRLCSSPAGHRMIHALKQHILDRHQRSEGECVRCAGRFGNAEALRSHQRQDQICEKRPFDAAQASSMQQLKIEEATRTGTDVEKWFRMWDILFPNIPPPASPYVEPGENEYTAEGRGRARPLPSEPPDHRDAISLPTAEGPPDFASYFQARTGNGAYAISEPQGRKATLNSILMEVDKWIASWPDVRSSLSHHRQPCCDDDQGSTGGTNSSSGTIGGSNGKDSNNGRQRGQKRRRGDERDKRERADGNDGNDDPAPGANEEPYERLSQNELKFACPFLKLYPWIFMHEKHCAGGGWLTTNRLKYVMFLFIYPIIPPPVVWPIPLPHSGGCRDLQERSRFLNDVSFL